MAWPGVGCVGRRARRDVSSEMLAALAAAVALGAVHVVAGRLRFLEGVPRKRLLSAAGGVSVAYVFVHLLPEVAAAQEHIGEGATGIWGDIERHAYLLALLGLATFYGVERAALVSRRRRRSETTDDVTDARTFVLSLTTFAVYNALIGHLVVERARDAGLRDMSLFAVALGLHFVVNDFGLRQHHKHQYDSVGRWVLAGAVLAGWLTGASAPISESALAVVLALLSGGVVLNVLKEELPAERDSRFPPFAAGAAAYAALLLAV